MADRLGLRLVIGGLAAAAASFATAPAALAGTAGIDGDTLVYAAHQGESNNVLIKYADHPRDICPAVWSNCIEAFDSAGLDLDGDDCRYRYPAWGDRKFILCPAVARVDAQLGDGDDKFNGFDGDSVIDAGPGMDQVDGAGGNDEIDGGDDSDALAGGSGDDRLLGGSGDDWLESRGWRPEEAAATVGGSDLIDGGPGNERVDYSRAGGPVRVTLDGIADDGPAGEADDIRGVEAIAGSEYDDVLTGDDGPNAIIGYGGADIISGGGGADTLDGEAGDDSLSGGPGNDDLLGGDHADRLDGGPGADALKGDKPCNVTIRFGCNGGDDIIQARDGERDTVTCGVGADQAVVDAADDVAADGSVCETVERGNVIAPPPPPPVVTARPLRLERAFGRGARTKVLRLRLRNLPAGSTVAVRCSAPRCLRGAARRRVSRARATLDLRPRLRVLRLPAGAVLTVGVTAPGRPALSWQFTMRRGRAPLARKARI